MNTIILKGIIQRNEESLCIMEPFKLERYFAIYEFSTRYLLCASDCESLSLNNLLSYADEEAKNLWQNLSLGYTDSLGHLKLREEISKLYKIVSPEQSLVVAPEEGIYIAMRCLLQPGDHVIAISPVYQSLYEVAKTIGCNVSQWHLHQEDNHWSLSLSDLKALVKPETKLVIVNFPHNPTGFIPDQVFFTGLVDFLSEKGLYLFSDEMYRLLEQNTSNRLPSACDVYSKAVTLSGLSKAFALPGLRIGWLATQNEMLYKKLTLYKDYTTICSSAPSEILAIIALRASQDILYRNMDIINKNLALAEAFFKQHTDTFRWLPPSGGSIAFPELLLDISIEKFCHELVRSKEVLLAPGNMFDAPGNHFRLGLGRKNFPEALKHLDEFIREM